MAKKKILSRQPIAERSEESTNRIMIRSQEIVSSDTFDWIIIGAILLQALALAHEATPSVISVGDRNNVDLL